MTQCCLRNTTIIEIIYDLYFDRNLRLFFESAIYFRLSNDQIYKIFKTIHQFISLGQYNFFIGQLDLMSLNKLYLVNLQKSRLFQQNNIFIFFNAPGKMHLSKITPDLKNEVIKNFQGILRHSKICYLNSKYFKILHLNYIYEFIKNFNKISELYESKYTYNTSFN